MCCTLNIYRSVLIPTNLPCSEKFLAACLNNEFYICFHDNSNDFAQASADGVINTTSVFNYSSLVACGGTERIAASPSIIHLTSLGHSWPECFGRLLMSFLNPALSGWYSVGFRIATARGTDAITYLNALVNLTTSLTYFGSMFSFYTPWKHQKTFGFLVISGGIKWEHWPEMG